MFWKYNTPSSVQIDALLQQENVSLQDLMEEEELLQECKSQNKKVIEFLTQPEILEELVSLLVTDPSPDKELQVRFKYANLASELLTCDVPVIVDKVASSSNLLQMLYKFLEKEKPLNPLLASFVSKVFGMLVQRRSEQNWYSYQVTCFQVLDFLKSQGDFVEVAVKHIGTSAVMGLLSKLICGVDDDDQEIKRGIHQWLNECRLIEQLIEKLTPDCDSEEHSSVDQLVSEIVNTGQDTSTNGTDSQGNGSQSWLLTTLESKEVINKLMDTLLHEDRSESSVTHVINILLTLLSFKGSHKQSIFHQTNSIDIINTEIDPKSIALRTIVARLPDLQKILLQPSKLGSLMTSYGVEVERIGSTRLKVVSLIAALIATQDVYVHLEMASLHTLQLLFDLFFKFSQNNFLHSQVTQCVINILSMPLCNDVHDDGNTQEMDGLNNNPQKLGDCDESNECDKEKEEKQNIKETLPSPRQPMLIQLFTECNIIQKILECYANEETLSDKKLHNMVGYMGHIREIANAIVQNSNEGPCAQIIQDQIKKLPNDILTQWEEFTLIALAEENLKNKIIPLQGFKEGDMDNISDMRFVDDFKEADDCLPGGSQRHLNQLMEGGNSSDAHCMNMDDDGDNKLERFQEMCAERSSDILEFDDIWKGKEKNITFSSTPGKPGEEEDAPHHSSSEEEEDGDIDDEFDSIRGPDDKMDIEFMTEEWEQKLHSDVVHTSCRKEWSDVFDKRGNPLHPESDFNPWESAPASDTTDNNSWADFGAGPFPTATCGPFVESDTHCSPPGFASFSPHPPLGSSSSSTSQTSAATGFQADFLNVFMSGPRHGSLAAAAPAEPPELAFQTDAFGHPHTESGDKVDSSSSSSEDVLETSVAQSGTIAQEPESLQQDACDASEQVASEQQK